MANVEHNTLTGAALHEPKGVAAAAANRVYVSDGAASGSWTTVSNSVLASTAKAFQAQLLHVVDQKATGTAGGDFTTGDWRTRVLNTERTNEISGASVSSNQITLPAGTYFIQASAPANKVTDHKTRLRNITDGTTTLVGTSENNITASTGDTMTRSHINGRFTIAGTKVFEIQHRCDNTVNGDGFGRASGYSEVEIYTDVMIWKVTD